MTKGSILVVEDDKTLLEVENDMLKLAGYSVMSALTAEEALSIAMKKAPDILLTDLVLPGMSGIDLIKKVKSFSNQTVCIILTGNGTVETAVNAMQAGAFTYLTKPFKREELLVNVAKALEVHSLQEENINLRRALVKEYKNFILGNSEKIQKVFDLIETVADTDSTVLILGESGTGKELVAKGLHYNSRRRDKPFVPINCGAIPEDLLESELFGHVKGAFTGAITSRQGRFEVACGGTLFLDEIGDMSPKLQVKILRVLQEREYEPVGATKSKKADVRVIAATNVDLEKAVADGKFREDLYYRLNVIPIDLPSLKERAEDICILVDHFIKKFNKEKGGKLKGLEPQVMVALTNYSWPGNVRELENLIERFVILRREGFVTMADLPEKIFGNRRSTVRVRAGMPPEGISLKDAVDDFENSLIMDALNRTNWNKNMAAKLLQLKRTTLVEKIKKKGINN